MQINCLTTVASVQYILNNSTEDNNEQSEIGKKALSS